MTSLAKVEDDGVIVRVSFDCSRGCATAIIPSADGHTASNAPDPFLMSCSLTKQVLAQLDVVREVRLCPSTHRSSRFRG